MSKLMVIAGEASGDLHGGNVILELKKLLPDLELIGTGGQLLEQAGTHLYYRAEDLAVIGITEVLKKYGYYKGIFDRMVQKLDEEKPDAVFLVDYAGFNLRFAAEAKKRGIPVIFYVAPQVWAWKKNRIKKMKKFIDHQLVLFPFEVEYLKNEGMESHCFGHPLLDIAKTSVSREEFCDKWNLPKDRKMVAILPGSRKNEVLKHMPVLVDMAERLKEQRPEIEIIYPLAPTVKVEEIMPYLEGVTATIHLIEADTYNAVGNADFAVVASGTATLETAVLQTPMLIFYKVSPITYFIGRHILKIGAVGLPNIIAGREIVPELLQRESSATEMTDIVLHYLDDPQAYSELKSNLAQLKHDLGETGAYQKTAAYVAELLK